MKIDKFTVKLSVICAVIVVSGCSSDMNTPLLFASSQTIGLSVSSSATENQGADITFGYKNRDFALVPTMAKGITGAPVEIRACYRVGVNVGDVADCGKGNSQNGDSSPKEQNPQVRDNISYLQGAANAQDANLLQMIADRSAQSPAALPMPRGGSFSPDIIRPMAVPIPLVEPDNKGEKAISIKTGDAAGAADAQNNDKTILAARGNAAESVRDSLSVFSSFDAKSDVKGGEVGITLGKAFATGVAAQHLTEGMNFYIQYKGQALVSGAKATAKGECIRALTAAMGEGKVTADALTACKS